MERLPAGRQEANISCMVELDPPPLSMPYTKVVIRDKKLNSKLFIIEDVILESGGGLIRAFKEEVQRSWVYENVENFRKSSAH